MYMYVYVYTYLYFYFFVQIYVYTYMHQLTLVEFRRIEKIWIKLLFIICIFCEPCLIKMI